MKKKYLLAIISEDNIDHIKKIIAEVELIEEADLLIIDEESNYDIFGELAEFKKVICIYNEKKWGNGGCLYLAINYFNNFDYEFLVIMDSSSKSIISDFENISSNLSYGYDLVTCSRILENFDHETIAPEIIEISEIINERLNSILTEPITDPFSFNKGMSRRLIKEVEITENNSNAMLQLFIQANYYGFQFIEIPGEFTENFGIELNEENLVHESLTLMETENYLYNKGQLN